LLAHRGIKAAILHSTVQREVWEWQSSINIMALRYAHSLLQITGGCHSVSLSRRLRPCSDAFPNAHWQEALTDATTHPEAVPVVNEGGAGWARWHARHQELCLRCTRLRRQRHKRRAVIGLLGHPEKLAHLRHMELPARRILQPQADQDVKPRSGTFTVCDKSRCDSVPHSALVCHSSTCSSIHQKCSGLHLETVLAHVQQARQGRARNKIEPHTQLLEALVCVLTV